MFSEEIIESRKKMLVEQLLLDKIANLVLERKESNDILAKREIDTSIKYLENMCVEISKFDILKMQEKDRQIIMDLLKKRIESLESGRPEKSKDVMQKLVDFLIYEYKLLLTDFIDASMFGEYIQKNKN